MPPDEVVTQIVPLRVHQRADAATLLRPFVPRAGRRRRPPRDQPADPHRHRRATSAGCSTSLQLVDVEVALNELQIIPLKHADAQELAQLLGPALRQRPPAPPRRPACARLRRRRPRPGVTPRPARPPARDSAAASGPLIVPERRSNSLVVHARKQDMETIRRLVEKLDVDIYGGQRVFIYFAENTKARGPGDARSTRSTAAATGAPRSPGRSRRCGRPAASRAPPAPAHCRRSRRAAAAGSRRPSSSRGRRRPAGARLPGVSGEGAPPVADIRFVADEVTNAIIVTTYPRLWREIEETIKKLDKMPRQVLIEVLAAEVTLTDDTKLGVEWAVRTGRSTSAPRPPALISRGRPAAVADPPRAAPCPSASTSSPSRPTSSSPRSTRWPARTRSTSCPTRPS